MKPGLDDPELVRREYASEERLAIRRSVWAGGTGPNPHALALQAIAECMPRRVLEVGCGQGDFAERLARELGADVVGLDQSERMVALTRARGIEAVVGDAQSLPFAGGAFDCAVAAWMLYHVPDIDRALAELVRVLHSGGRLIAITNSDRNLAELWDLFGRRSGRVHPFSAENGEAILRRHFDRVTRRDVAGTISFADREAAARYVAASVTRADLAGALPPFDGPLEASRLVTIFVAETREAGLRPAGRGKPRPYRPADRRDIGPFRGQRFAAEALP